MSEKYPKKRAYATGKLYKFLKEKGAYKQFALNCKKNNSRKGQKEAEDFLGAFNWKDSKEEVSFWIKLYREFLSEQT